MSQAVFTKGNLEYRERQCGDTHVFFPVLVRCPLCEIPFKSGMHRASHISKHSPEDFGLSPMISDD